MDAESLSFGCWLQQQLDMGEMTQADLARRMGVSTGLVSDWIRDNKRPQSETCYKIADALGIDADAVLFMAGRRRTLDRPMVDYENARKIDHLVAVTEELKRKEVSRWVWVHSWGRIPADSFRWESASTGREKESVRVPAQYIGTRSLKDLFVVQASGECLADLKIHDGVYVLCRKLYDEKPKNGDIVVARIGDEYTMKRYFAEGDWIHLKNGADVTVYSVSIIDAAELDIQGVKLKYWEPSDED